MAIDERNGFIYYNDEVSFIIRRATLTGENITDIMDLGPGSTFFPEYVQGRVCNIIFLLVLDQYCQYFKYFIGHIKYEGICQIMAWFPHVKAW